MSFIGKKKEGKNNTIALYKSLNRVSAIRKQNLTLKKYLARKILFTEILFWNDSEKKYLVIKWYIKKTMNSE